MVPILSAGATYGKILNRREIPGFSFKEVVYRPDLQVPPHTHEHATLYVVLQGTYTEIYGKRTLTPKPFSLAFHPANEVHWHHCHDVGGRCFVVEVEPRWIERIREYSRTLDEPADLQRGLPACLAMRLYKEFRQDDDAAPLAMEGLAVEILAEASRHPVRISDRRPPSWLDQARELLHARFSEPLTLDEIAVAVGIHPGHLASVFRQHHHSTIGEYLRRLRVEFVCGELARSDASLADLALDAGFADQSHLTRTFKRLLGTTPLQFRSLMRSQR
jgi:AraC family transcriptional regulator